MCHRQKQNRPQNPLAGQARPSKEKKLIYLAGGCFWGMEKYLSLIPGVIDTQVGYANGNTENPTYEDVCHRDTGHAETVRVEYDASRIHLPDLLKLYFGAVDPLSPNRQGNDVGAQYRTGIYYVHPQDELVIRAEIERLQAGYQKPIAIEAGPLLNYYPAEDYHQDYLTKNPRGYCHIGPDLFEKARSFGGDTGAEG